MTMAAAGVAKLIEECGELTQVLGKKLAWWDTDEPHWDGTVLRDRIVDEMADVQAAIYFVISQLGLDERRFDMRSLAKGKLFDTWQEQFDNNDHGIDGGPDAELRAALVLWRQHGYHEGLSNRHNEANDRLKAAIDGAAR